MAPEKRTGLTIPAGILEPTTPLETEEAPAPEEAPSPRVARAKRPRKATGHTLYLADGLWERLLVQSHRRKLTISDYVGGILERQVPDHRARSRGADAEAVG